MKKKEFQIGDKIQLGNISLIVKESYEYDCHNCFFYKLCRYECYKEVTNMVGECTSINRKDEKSVVFVKVDE